MKPTVLAALCLAAALPAGAAAAEPAEGVGGTAYTATLQPLNGSGASGSAEVVVAEDGQTITARVQVEGLDLDAPHAQHLHALFDGDLQEDPAVTDVQSAACPTTESGDANGDGVLTTAEGAPAYGTIQMSLTTEGDTGPDSGLAVDRFPAGTSISYERSGIPLPPALSDEVAAMHVVVHGTDVDGSGDTTDVEGRVSSLDESLPLDATAPALCGTLAATSAGAVQTGLGGTATDGDGSTGVVAGLGAAAALAAAGGLALRRRRATT